MSVVDEPVYSTEQTRKIRDAAVNSVNRNGDSLVQFMDKYNDLEHNVRSLLSLVGEDPTRQGLQETPFRFVKAMLEYTKGYTEDPKKHLEKEFAVDTQELVLVKNIEFYSLCEHHLAPFFGTVSVGYIPQAGQITGLSKIARMVEGYARRLQVQERLTKQIADAMVDVLNPYGVMVVVTAKHMCMASRGIQKSDALTTTSAVRGLFKDSNTARQEFLQLIREG